MPIRGVQLHAVDWTSETASAQVKSAILLAALIAGVRAEATEPVKTRDHTERMLGARGAHLTVHGEQVVIDPSDRVDATDVVVPGDPSSAAFFARLDAIGGEGARRLEH